MLDYPKYLVRKFFPLNQTDGIAMMERQRHPRISDKRESIFSNVFSIIIQESLHNRKHSLANIDFALFQYWLMG